MNRSFFASLGAALLASCAALSTGGGNDYVYVVESSGGA
jgi:hypothetical protein